MASEAEKKLESDVKKFLDVYKVLSAEAKAQFEAQLNGEIKKADERSKKYYLVLLQAAKDGCSVEQAISRLKQSSQK
ncbi:MAG: hypothetical protein KKA31_01110 [Candidatus Margulisbacteria bacterium]|nr:hypothetical protein [Candidatus Margulisiibacteriota bacterium]